MVAMVVENTESCFPTGTRNK